VVFTTIFSIVEKVLGNLFLKNSVAVPNALVTLIANISIEFLNVLIKFVPKVLIDSGVIFFRPINIVLSSEVREKTVSWIAENTSFMSFDLDAILVMRDEGDYTADDTLKRSWYENMLSEDKSRLVAVFDDRDRVVKMWRDVGVTCFQVADGEF
jgi:hypothetical protein